MFLPSKLRERENALLFRLRPTFGLTVPEGIVGVRSGIDLMSRVYTAMFLDKKNLPLCARMCHSFQQFRGQVAVTLVLGGKMSHTCPSLA